MGKDNVERSWEKIIEKTIDKDDIIMMDITMDIIMDKTIDKDDIDIS